MHANCTNIESETRKASFATSFEHERYLSRHGRWGWDPRLPLHIQLVIYESCTHIAHLLITKETAAFPPPIPIFVPVDFSMSLLVSRRLI